MNNNNKIEQLVSISLEKNGGGMIGKKRSRNEIAFSNEDAVHQNNNQSTQNLCHVAPIS